MRQTQRWKLLAFALASFAIAALAAEASNPVKVARLQFDGGVSDVPTMELDAGSMEQQDFSVDAGLPSDLQGSRGGKRSFARTVVE